MTRDGILFTVCRRWTYSQTIDDQWLSDGSSLNQWGQYLVMYCSSASAGYMLGHLCMPCSVSTWFLLHCWTSLRPLILMTVMSFSWTSISSECGWNRVVLDKAESLSWFYESPCTFPPNGFCQLLCDPHGPLLEGNSRVEVTSKFMIWWGSY